VPNNPLPWPQPGPASSTSGSHRAGGGASGATRAGRSWRSGPRRGSRRCWRSGRAGIALAVELDAEGVEEGGSWRSWSTDEHATRNLALLACTGCAGSARSAPFRPRSHDIAKPRTPPASTRRSAGTGERRETAHPRGHGPAPVRDRLLPRTTRRSSITELRAAAGSPSRSGSRPGGRGACSLTCSSAQPATFPSALPVSRRIRPC
jgi:hypothetical protein